MGVVELFWKPRPLLFPDDHGSIMLCHSQDITNGNIEASSSDLEPEKQLSSMGRESFSFVVVELMSVPGAAAKLIQISPCGSAARVDVTPVSNV